MFRDNITGHGNYGIHGPIDQRSDAARAMFQNNVFMNLNRVSPDDYAFPPEIVLFRASPMSGFADPSRRISG